MLSTQLGKPKGGQARTKSIMRCRAPALNAFGAGKDLPGHLALQWPLRQLSPLLFHGLPKAAAHSLGSGSGYSSRKPSSGQCYCSAENSPSREQSLTPYYGCLATRPTALPWGKRGSLLLTPHSATKVPAMPVSLLRAAAALCFPAVPSALC